MPGNAGGDEKTGPQSRCEFLPAAIILFAHRKIQQPGKVDQIPVSHYPACRGIAVLTPLQLPFPVVLLCRLLRSVGCPSALLRVQIGRKVVYCLRFRFQSRPDLMLLFDGRKNAFSHARQRLGPEHGRFHCTVERTR